MNQFTKFFSIFYSHGELHKSLYYVNHKQAVKGFLQNNSENFGKKYNVAHNLGKMFKKCKEFLSNLAAGLSLAILLKMHLLQFY